MDDPSTMSVTEGFGLMFYNARMYDPAIGRFTSADSIVPGGVQGLDRYAYVNNSPLNFSDPSGHVPCQGENYDDGPQCLAQNPTAYNPGTLDDFENMTWRNRKDWLASFAQRNRLENWFADMGSAIDFMISDPSLAREGGTAEVMDAAVLQAINDGWLMFTGEQASGDGGQGWANFFQDRKDGITGGALIASRLQAEQYGVDYAWGLASTQSAYNNSSELDQIYFTIFKGGADGYRSMASSFRSDPLAVSIAENTLFLGPLLITPATDPRTSGPYLNFAGGFGYPAAVAIWSWGNSIPPTTR